MCDCLVALPGAAGGATLFAKNSDRPTDEVQQVEVLAAREERRTVCTYVTIDGAERPTIPSIVSRPTWCWGVEHGVNWHGVAIGNEAIYTTADPRSAPPALTGLDLVRLGLERAASAGDAVRLIVELIERYGQGGSCHDPAGQRGAKAYWSSFLIADPTSAFVLETSGREWAIEEVGDARALSNRTTIAAFDVAHRHPRQPVERRVDPRLEASRAVLAGRPVTVASLTAHLRSHVAVEPGWSVCMHVDGVEHTAASMVARLGAGGTSELWMATGSPCITDYVRRGFDEPVDARSKLP